MNLLTKTKILIVSPFFNPYGGVGANRMTSLANYLVRDKDFNITVLRNNVSTYQQKVVRENINENIFITEANTKDSFLYNLDIYIKKIIELFSVWSFDCVVISVGPFYTLPLVKLINKKYEIPVILDIRDIWAHEPTNLEIENNFKSVVKNLTKDFLFLNNAFQNAYKIVTMSEEESFFIKENYGLCISPKVVVIKNGYDDYLLDDQYLAENFLKKFNFLSNDGFIISTFGKFSEYLSDEMLSDFCGALALINKTYYPLSFLHVGTEEKTLRECMEHEGINYISTGYLNYHDGMNLLISFSDINVLSSDLVGLGYGTKFYDYIYCNKPMVLVAESNVFLFNKVNLFENGYSCKNKKEIYSAFLEIIESNVSTLDNNLNIYKFSRSYNNELYRKLLRASLRQE